MKYEGPNSYQSKDMAIVKVLLTTNGQTDGQMDILTNGYLSG